MHVRPKRLVGGELERHLRVACNARFSIRLFSLFLLGRAEQERTARVDKLKAKEKRRLSHNSHTKFERRVKVKLDLLLSRHQPFQCSWTLSVVRHAILDFIFLYKTMRTHRVTLDFVSSRFIAIISWSQQPPLLHTITFLYIDRRGRGCTV